MEKRKTRTTLLGDQFCLMVNNSRRGNTQSKKQNLREFYDTRLPGALETGGHFRSHCTADGGQAGCWLAFGPRDTHLEVSLQRPSPARCHSPRATCLLPTSGLLPCPPLLGPLPVTATRPVSDPLRGHVHREGSPPKTCLLLAVKVLVGCPCGTVSMKIPWCCV